jgi:CBS domain-containing protein
MHSAGNITQFCRNPNGNGDFLMNTTVEAGRSRLTLTLQTAKELMTPEPITVRAGGTVKQAIAMMVDRGVSALPVVDDDGRPVGVLSQTDIVIHDRNKQTQAPAEYYTTTNLLSGSTRLLARFSLDDQNNTRVHEIMTPTVFAVRPDDPVTRVVGDMVAFKIHRLFVIDKSGALLGVISAFDVLRKLRADD